MSAMDASTLTGVLIIAGHYGVGKTNLALNVCVDAARAGKRVTCVDLDIVNPYFRSSDYEDLLRTEGIDMIAPLFAHTSLDSPGLSGRTIAAIEAARASEDALVVIDAGGDDVGATALGRFAATIAEGQYAFWYVVNAYRNLTQTPEEALALLPEIERASHLRATGIVNNSHLKAETTSETIRAAASFGSEVAGRAGLPLVCTTVPNSLFFSSRAENLVFGEASGLYPVHVYVTAPWER